MALKYQYRIFKESQRFDQWWVWVMLAAVTLVPVYGMYQQYVLEQPFGDEPMSSGGLFMSFLLILAVDMLFMIIRLRTHINAHQIEMFFFPFKRKIVQWAEVDKAEVVDYGFVGWGIRLFTRYGTVYNIKGSKGLAIQLKSGKKFLIGTQKPNDLIQFLLARDEAQSIPDLS
ncbi:hypothetical protein IFO69_19865 [Echinicola sp. CAU 1574]|uniref:PH domain-containing protein n=1 Tax=Echinicola arenosa TaxID=2774144 RepID=A0ABR9AQN9_9BACT|nr:hypothetical protein [Echinicola arenosa]MBD8491020.1 hypothetical protein [Echinicola arenosa]